MSNNMVEDAWNLLKGVTYIVLVFLIFCVFYVMGNVYINPHADLRLTKTTETFEYTGFPFSITGNYYETNGYYVLKPNPIFSLGVNPVCYVKKLDGPYIDLVGYPENQYGRKFIDKDIQGSTNQSDGKLGILHRNGVITFVPSTD